ncbi:MAG: VOC family protein [Candidatus Lokiarchaeota archaeon]|nr:VOC family protein [Candidatus Lokiarchaeota archaeon]
MRIEHIAVSSNTEEDSEDFFTKLLDMKRERTFLVSEDLTEQFFGVRKEQKIIRYGNDEMSVEVFITDDNSKKIDKFTHICLIIEDREKLIERAKQLNFKLIKVPRKNSDGYYLFLKDYFGNLYEIK